MTLLSKIRPSASLLLLLITAIAAVQADDLPPSMVLFDSGREGYPRYRIPALLTTAKGTVLAFCEGRNGGRGLDGDIDLVCKRSSDSGKTWSAIQLVADDGSHTLGNPCPVIDREDGTIWLALTRSLGTDTEDSIVAGQSREPTRVFLTESTDDGRTWSELRDITKTTKQPNWTWYGTGPGVGLQLRQGRLAIPCYHAEAETKIYRSHMIFSDDRGKSWQLGKPAGQGCTECQIAERLDGTLVVSSRSIQGEHTRTIGISRNGGATWEPTTRDPALYDSYCQAALFTVPDALKDKPQWLFCHPAGPNGRKNLTVRLSADEGRTWPTSLPLRAGDSQYSCLSQLPDRKIGCLYESWTDGNYRLYFTKFDVSQLNAK